MLSMRNIRIVKSRWIRRSCRNNTIKNIALLFTLGCTKGEWCMRRALAKLGNETFASKIVWNCPLREHPLCSKTLTTLDFILRSRPKERINLGHSTPLITPTLRGTLFNRIGRNSLNFRKELPAEKHPRLCVPHFNSGRITFNSTCFTFTCSAQLRGVNARRD